MMKKFTTNDIFYTLIIALLAVIIFSLGYFIANLLKVQKPPIVVEKIADDFNYTESSQTLQPRGAGQEEKVVASVNSDKFHYLYCPGAKTIKAQNKIYFPNAAEAISAGFMLAGNCR